MGNIFSVDHIAFTIFSYPMSYIEFVGTILYLWSVWLISRRNILTWPVGIVSVLLFMGLFYQIRLYSDTLEQVYYFGASLYGWWIWHKGKTDDEIAFHVRFSSRVSILVWVVVTFAASLLAGNIVSRVHVFFPGLFPEPASFPFLDALTTVMSFVAMFMMAQKRTESWLYWIIVDVIGIWLYYAKGVAFISVLYIVLFFMAVNGFLAWLKETRKLSIVVEN